MRYSFIIPTYNKTECLRKTLQALNHFPGFDCNDYEVVVVDDGSPEPVFNSIKGVNHNYYLNYLYLERCKESCRARARNYGIHEARGDNVIFIDDDIVVNSDYLREAERYYRYSDDLVIASTRLHCQADRIESCNIRNLRKKACGDIDTALLEVRHMVCHHLSYNMAAHKYPWMMAFTSNLVVPRKYLIQEGGFDENFKKWGYEDTELGYRLFRAGARYVFNSRMEAFHQAHPQAPPGESNRDYFLEKCKDAFTDIDPGTFFLVYSLTYCNPKLIPTFRKYQGKVSKQVEVEISDASELEAVKNRTLELIEEGEVEIVVNDYCENTDLDIWVQMLDIENAVISYYPRSLKINKWKIREKLGITELGLILTDDRRLGDFR